MKARSRKQARRQRRPSTPVPRAPRATAEVLPALVELNAGIVIESSTDLSMLEQIVAVGSGAFVLSGRALARIRDGELYRAAYKTFEDYCLDRWGWSDRHARRLIAAAKAVDEGIYTPPGPMGPAGVQIPNERQVRELVGVAPELAQGVLFQARVEAGGGEVTAEKIREVASRLRPAAEVRADGKAKSPGLQVRRTPRWLFDFLSARFGPFVLDAYATPANALCSRYLTEHDDANKTAWEDATFANPPFRVMSEPVLQAIRQGEAGVNSIMLTPIGGSQDWFHQHAIRGTVYKPDRRINFDTPDGGSTDPLESDASGADRDTDIIGFGPRFWNPNADKGEFRVIHLELPKGGAP